METTKNLVRTRGLAAKDFYEIRHPLNPNSHVRMYRLSDRAGLQRAHLSIARVPAGKESFIPHAHLNEEEFMFVLEGRGVATIGSAEVEIGPGDYLGFPADGTAHHLRNTGEADLVYLMGGERVALEVSRFPTKGQLAIFHEGRVTFYEEASSTQLPLIAWLAKKPE